MTEAREIGLVSVLLIFQSLLAIISFDPSWTINIFCSATREPALELFGLIHAIYTVLFLVGLASLMWQRLRLFYIIAIALSLLALPVQAWLVQEERLYCDSL